MKSVQTHTFNKQRYKIYIGPLKGICDVDKHPPLSLFVRTSAMSERQILTVLIHEALHACNWDKSEKVVERTSKDISSFLWRLGFRRGK